MTAPVKCPRCGSYKTLVTDALLMVAKCLAAGCGQIFRIPK